MSETDTPPVIDDSHPLTLDRFNKALIALYEFGIDDVLVQDGEELAIKAKGRLKTVGTRPLELETVQGLLDEMHRATASATLQEAKDHDFTFSVQKDRRTSYRFRVNATGSLGKHGNPLGVDITMRAIDQIPPRLDALDVPPDLAGALFPEAGTVIVGGETGSGKSTMLGAVIRDILTDTHAPKRIVSYESPIEFDFRAIPKRTGRIAQSDPYQNLQGYARAGANALRRNPDIILLGEARDSETISGAIGNAETGHTVYTTVHVNSVAETFSRMISVFPSSERMRALSGLVSATQVLMYQELINATDGGRVAAREYLVLDDSIRTELYETPEDQITRVMKKLVWEKGRPLIRDIEQLYTTGRISEQTHQRYQAEFQYREQQELA